MGKQHDDIAELRDCIASILELPEEEQAAAFGRLRDAHPERREFLVRCEEAAMRLVPGGEPPASLVEALAAVGGASGGDTTHPDRIGPYEIAGVLGEGGMGTVYLAEQHVPVRRQVALKVIKLGMATHEVVARFDAERQALALMDHPSIAHVLDAGTTPEGQPYFAMEHVPGTRITDYCNRRGLGLEPRIRLFRQVCFAVQHAHQKCVLHRDIKPSNILVRDHDGEPLPKIIDFGVAKATDRSLTERTLFTEQGRLIGTPAYMSPEQAAMTDLGVDARSDIYSLGVLLYELLTGSLPFSARELMEAGFSEIQRRIREDEPPKPSTRMTTRGEGTQVFADGLRADPSELARALRGDLDWITMRCLEKDPARRYQSASELAADLQRYLDHEPVEAGPPSTAYRLRKFLRKRRRSVAAASGMVLALVAGLVIAISQAGVAEAARLAESFERRRAEGAEKDAKRAESRARQSEQQARTALASYQQLKDVPIAEDLLREVGRDLWPAHPDKVPAMVRWLARARGLVAGAAEHRERVQGLRSRALPPPPDVETRLVTRARLQTEIDAKREQHDRAAAAAAPSGAAQRRLPQLAAELMHLEAKLARVDAEIRGKRWRFTDPEDRFLYAVFAELVANIDRLDGEEGLIAQVATRCERAATLKRRSLDDHAADWRRVAANTAASERYRGMQALSPQLGLVPLGCDPESGLEEFAVLDSGVVPARDARGSLQIDGASAIVLVLLPPGRFPMGAQARDPNAPNYDPQAAPMESPVREVELDAFFMSKYEMTQGQWLRVMGTNPSVYSWQTMGGRAVAAQNPVENITWYESAEAARRLGLLLPTEAQWEYAARAGTTTVWWTGQEPASLAGAENTSHKDQSTESWVWVSDRSDGHSVHAPIGSFRPNAFGLHEFVGNVLEACRDEFDYYGPAARPGDGLLVPVEGTGQRTYRGGCWSLPANRARSAGRRGGLPDSHSCLAGMRASREIDG